MSYFGPKPEARIRAAFDHSEAVLLSNGTLLDRLTLPNGGDVKPLTRTSAMTVISAAVDAGLVARYGKFPRYQYRLVSTWRGYPSAQRPAPAAIAPRAPERTRSAPRPRPEFHEPTREVGNTDAGTVIAYAGPVFERFAVLAAHLGLVVGARAQEVAHA